MGKTAYSKKNVELSKHQLKELQKSVDTLTPISLRLSKSQLSGGKHPLFITGIQEKRIVRNGKKKGGGGTELKLSKAQLTHLRKGMKGGTIPPYLVPLLVAVATPVAKATGEILADTAKGTAKRLADWWNKPKSASNTGTKGSHKSGGKFTPDSRILGLTAKLSDDKNDEYITRGKPYQNKFPNKDNVNPTKLVATPQTIPGIKAGTKQYINNTTIFPPTLQTTIKGGTTTGASGVASGYGVVFTPMIALQNSPPTGLVPPHGARSGYAGVPPYHSDPSDVPLPRYHRNTGNVSNGLATRDSDYDKLYHEKTFRKVQGGTLVINRPMPKPFTAGYDNSGLNVVKTANANVAPH